MFFDSTVFFVFLSIVVAVYWRLGYRRQNWFLLICSYFFYGWWDYRFLFLMGASTCINYYLSHRLEALGDPRTRKRLLIAALVINFSFLGFFKYFNFFTDSFVELLRSFGVDASAKHWLTILLPPGISFYTFQEVAYLVDVYRRDIPPARRLTDYALFVSVFPHLIAGPIQRPNHLLPQVQQPRRRDPQRFFDGLLLILEGAFRKIVIADNCALVADAAFSGKLGSPNLPVVMLGAFAFAWQIYGDFSGYSSMARGAAQLLGLHFMVNFQQPYLATSLQSFWRRWHISLSTWLRDYLYIALGGSRQGVFKTYRNLLYTMVLGGLWHGANWTFVIWGAIHGAGLALERFFGAGAESNSCGAPSIAAQWLRRVVVFNLVGISWVFFRAPSVAEASTFLAGAAHWSWIPEYAVAFKFLGFFAILLFCCDLRIERCHEEYAFQNQRLSIRVGFGVLLLLLIFLLGANQSNAFIYFQF
jgi:D-alanyl-lipoteichoic acid acyltransferase DltB (MBOAT superfamily)